MQTSKNFQIYNASAGSGKTFTLVKEYLKILLGTGKMFNAYRFKKILAITFTNKAAAEMKDRVLSNLKAFSNGEKNDMLEVIQKELSIPFKTIQERSLKIYSNIIQNYSGFNITTIDAFTHKIIRSFSFDLGLSLNFDVELDSNQLLNEAVDLMISKIGDDEKLTKVLIDFSLDKSDDDKSWDISRDLKEFAKVLLNETDANQLKKLSDKSIDDFTNFKKHLLNQNQTIEKKFKEIGEKALSIFEENNLNDGVYRGSYFPNHFKNLYNDFTKTKFFDDSKLKYNIENDKIYNKKAENFSETLAIVEPKLFDLYLQSEKLYQKHLLNRLILKNLIPLATLKYISDSLEEIKAQNNILLISEFNQLISNHLRKEPVPFIYERLGEKFQYYFIDEMQDTSELQWNNLFPLIENALVSETLDNEKGKLLLVGDAKQSIYRWRGGKAEQFIELTNNKNSFTVPSSVENLDTNYRSYSEIVDFNNQFFTHISDYFDNASFRQLYEIGNRQFANIKKGGYVQISFVERLKDDEKELVIPKKILKTIKDLEGEFQFNEICILVRKKKDGIIVSNYLLEQSIPIISSETLLLKNDSKINFIINLLKYLTNNKDKEALVNALYFLSLQLNLKDNHQFYTDFLKCNVNQVFENLKNYNINFNSQEFFSLSLYRSIEYLIDCFNLSKNIDAYIVSFLDIILDFEQTKGNLLQDFTEYWKLKEETLCVSISQEVNAVQIMTIHKSKGLEFPVVIFPYDLDLTKEKKDKIWYDKLDNEDYLNFETVLLNNSKKISNTGEYGSYLYQQSKIESQLDSTNLLYVALTRPVEQLYVITEKQDKISEIPNAKYYSDFFIDFLKNKTDSFQEDKLEYCFGKKIRNLKKESHFKEKELITFNHANISSWNKHNIQIAYKSSNLINTKQSESIKYGNLLHQILANIITYKDVNNAINQFIFQGVVSEKESFELSNIINQIVYHEELKQYYLPNLEVYNEQEIYVPNMNAIFIPDRMVVYQNQVVIIDYKTGAKMQKHKSQLNNYANTLIQMNYEVKEKILVYINSKIEINKL